MRLTSAAEARGGVLVELDDGMRRSAIISPAEALELAAELQAAACASTPSGRSSSAPCDCGSGLTARSCLCRGPSA